MIEVDNGPAEGTYPVSGQTSKQLLIKLINAKNGLELQVTDVVLAAPVALSGDASGKNTSVAITPAGTHRYTGSQTVKYNRLDLAVALAGTTLAADPNWTTTVDLIPAINAATGLNLCVDDIENDDLTGDPFPYTQTLYALDGSYGYMGEYDLLLLAPGSVVASA